MAFRGADCVKFLNLRNGLALTPGVGYCILEAFLYSAAILVTDRLTHAGADPLLSGVVPILTLLSLTMVISVLTMKSPGLRAVLCGRPSVVILNGRVQEQEIRRNRLTLDELAEELRLQGCPDPAAVKCAILETSGRLSVLPYAAEKPPGAKDLGLSVAEPGLPTVLISDGRLLSHNLKRLGYEEEWLRRQLARYGLKRAEQVFFLTVDESGGVYCIPKGGGK